MSLSCLSANSWSTNCIPQLWSLLSLSTPLVLNTDTSLFTPSTRPEYLRAVSRRRVNEREVYSASVLDHADFWLPFGSTFWASDLFASFHLPFFTHDQISSSGMFSYPLCRFPCVRADSSYTQTFDAFITSIITVKCRAQPEILLWPLFC